jgi:hypothetical protein
MPQTAETGFCDVVLYSGMGLTMVGLVITVVGLGDKGFHSIELRMMGPIIAGCGVMMASVRILVCILPSMQMGKIWGGWGKGEEGDKVGLINGEGRLTHTTVSKGRGMVGTPLIRSKNKGCDQKYNELKRTRFMREGDLVSMIGFQNAREPARQIGDYAHKGTFKNFMKMPHQIVSDFGDNHDKLQDCDEEGCSDSGSETFSVFGV